VPQTLGFYDACSLGWGQTNKGLVLMVSWIDDNLIIASKKVTRKKLKERFNCKDCRELEE
jgi:hypothetical protein